MDIQRVKRIFPTPESVLKVFYLKDNMLYWHRRVGSRCALDKPAGWYDTTGYRKVIYKKIKIYAHHLIFYITYGYLPENYVDHIDGDKLNNDPDNLREVSVTCNTRNTRLYKNNKSGFKGVSITKTGGYGIHLCGKHVGLSTDLKTAVLMRFEAELKTGFTTCDAKGLTYNLIKKRFPELEQQLLQLIQKYRHERDEHF